MLMELASRLRGPCLDGVHRFTSRSGQIPHCSFPFYDQLHELYDGNIATGEYAVSPASSTSWAIAPAVEPVGDLSTQDNGAPVAVGAGTTAASTTTARLLSPPGGPPPKRVMVNRLSAVVSPLLEMFAKVAEQIGQPPAASTQIAKSPMAQAREKLDAYCAVNPIGVNHGAKKFYLKGILADASAAELFLSCEITEVSMFIPIWLATYA